MECPAAEVSIVTDSLFLTFGSWVFLAYLYYTHHHASSMDDVKEAEETAKQEKITQEKAKKSAPRAADSIIPDVVAAPDENKPEARNALRT